MNNIFPVFVNNIDIQVQTKDLRKLFSRYGNVKEVTIISSHGFVNFGSADDAVTAIKYLNNYNFFGRRLSVETSKELDDFLRNRERSFHERRRSLDQRPHHYHHHQQQYQPRRHHEEHHHHFRSRSRSEDAQYSMKRKVRLNSSTNSSDLRDVLQSKKPRVEEPEELPQGVEELYVGNLFKAVEKSDLEDLLDGYGKVMSVEMFATHALVRIECNVEAADEAIEALDYSEWMDNNIRVKFSTRVVRRKIPPQEEEEKVIKDDEDEKEYEIWVWSSILKKDNFLEDMSEMVTEFAIVQDKTWRQENESILLKLKCPESQIIQCLTFMNKELYHGHSIRAKFPDKSDSEEDLSKKVENYPMKLLPDTFLPSSSTKSVDKKIKVREIWLWSPAINAKKSFLQDMKDIVSQFGKVQDHGWKNEHIFIELESSEKQAAKCIRDTHGMVYKATNVRAKFADGTPEDDLYKEPTYSIILRNYDKELMPKNFEKTKIPEVAKIPEEKAKSKSKSPQPQNQIPIIFHPKPRVLQDAMFIESVEGQIYSVSSKLILVGFKVGNNSQRFARIKPGHMFIDGKKSFGYITKDLRFPDWPEDLKNVFQVGKEIIMDVRRISSQEEQEMLDLTSEVVSYEASLIWRTCKPLHLNIKQSQTILKATVIKLWPKWAVLQPLIYNGDKNLVLLDKENFHSSESSEINSLLNHLEIGDTLAVMVDSKEYLDMAEKAKSLEFFNERTNNLKYDSILAWALPSEIDPYNVLRKREVEKAENVQFLASSNNLNMALPSEKEATYRKWKGYIEELHIPSGGIVRLTESSSQKWASEKQRVYFHRSRLFVNGIRMLSSTVLDEEIAIGDPVTVDVVANQIDMTTTYMSGTEAFWMGLSVKVNTVDRGLTIANRLRAEGLDPSVYESKVCQGRVVYLKPPENEDASVCSGVAVIDSGPFSGQRIEFEAEQCFLFGYSLARADLSFVFHSNEPVCIMVKSYNSYIIDKLWIGSDVKNNSNDTEGRMQLQKFLFDHGLDRPSLEQMLKGICPKRPFVPIEGQTLKGVIKGLKADDEGRAITAVVEADIGELLFMEVPRERVFVYGHWMGKADLRYLFDKEEVCFEIHQVFAKEEHLSTEVIQPSLVWMGDETTRPKYSGQSTSLIINEQMDAELWKFVGSKKMDVKMFKALVEGRLPPKERNEKVKTKGIAKVATADGSTVEVDEDDLAQAALFKQMKAQFGKDALMKAMMQLVKQTQEDN